MPTGKDYIELLEKKNFRLDKTTYDILVENEFTAIYIYKKYISNNNNGVEAAISLRCSDIKSFLTVYKEFQYSPYDLNTNTEHQKQLDEKTDYSWFDCTSINVYGEVMILESLDDDGEELRGIGLKNKKYFGSYVNPYYELNLGNLEQVLYIQNSKDKTAHINFLLQNYIYYYNKIIEPIIIPVMNSIGAVCRSRIQLIVENKEGWTINNELRIDFIKESFDEEGLYLEKLIFSVYVDFLFCNLYGTIENENEDSSIYKYVDLNNITKEELIKILNE